MHCTVGIIPQGCAHKYQHHKSAEKSAKYLGRKAMICNGNWSEDYDEYKKMTHLVLEKHQYLRKFTLLIENVAESESTINLL